MRNCYHLLFGLLIFALVLSTATTVSAGSPQLVSYQGLLSDAVGDPLNTTVDLTFTVYDDPSAGSVIWTETQAAVTVTEGLFNVLLGSVTPLVDTVFNDTTRYLGITVGGDPELTPRARIVTTPYSFRVSTVDGASGGIISGDVSIQSDLTVSGKATIGPGHTNTGLDAFITGSGNTGSGDYSTVGGLSNDASGNKSVISGGVNNQAIGETSTLAGGSGNVASGVLSFLGGGSENVASGQASVLGGGGLNLASGDLSTVGGGAKDTASGTYATVSGGLLNVADTSYTTVAGGGGNRATGHSAAIGGGLQNTASGDRATVPGGSYNSAAGNMSFAAGYRAKANHRGTFVWADSTDADFTSTAADQFLIRASGGVGIGTTAPTEQLEVAGIIYSNTGGIKFPDNTVQTTAAGAGASGWTDDGTVVRLDASADSVGIGTSTPSEKLDVVGNMVVSGKATIGPGHTNTGLDAFITGSGNTGSGDYSTVGGLSNDASGNKSVISGGTNNQAIGETSTVGGGSGNVANGVISFLGGGGGNVASGVVSTVGGGQNNLASGDWSTVGGGEGDTASASYATVAGGRHNAAADNYAAVGGGFSNKATGHSAAIGGGWGNLAGGDRATVPGGSNNSAAGNMSFAAGYRAKANHRGTFIWADSTNADFTSTAADQFNVRASGGTRIFSNSGLTTGVTLSAGGGAWAAVSDRNVKENIRPVSGDNILEKISQLDITRWNYITQDESIEHIGPMAQDFYELFGVGDNNTTITTIDPDGISLAAIKALIEKNQSLEARNDELNDRLDKLEKMIEDLTQQ